MDPQKNASSPSSFNPGQPQPGQGDSFQSTSMQPEQPATPPGALQPAQEVTVDFNQDAQNAGQPATQPSTSFGMGGMPSIGSDVPGAAPGGPAGPGFGGPAQPDGMPGQGMGQAPLAGPADGGFGAAPGAGPAPMGQPGGLPPQGDPGFGAPGAGAVPQQPGSPAAPGGFGAQPGQPQPQQAAFMNPDPQPAVPATAPATSVKADKKTIMILACVAVVLIAAIAVLLFM